MRHLYEQLKPETRHLIKECSGPMQLERSMIAQKKEAAQTRSTGYVFQPACGFKFKAPSDTQETGNEEASQGYTNKGDVQVTLQDRITAIDMQVELLLQEKNALLEKVQALEIRKVNLDMYDVLCDMVAKGKDIQDPVIALHYANNAIAPQKHIIQLNSTSFKNMLHVLPKSYPSSWTYDDASNFFQSVSDALEEDFKTVMQMPSSSGQG
jgi:hypothetical protein